MNNIFKKLTVLQIIFAVMICRGSLSDEPLKEGSMEQFLRVPDLLPSMFCTDLRQCFVSRVLCTGKENRPALCIREWSNNRIVEFLAKRMKSCIKGAFELVAFTDQSFIKSNLHNDLSFLQRFLWPAFKKVVKEDSLMAAFVCQQNPHCRNFIQQVIPETEKECLKTISCIAQNFRQTYRATTLNLGDDSAVHTCVIIHDDLLVDGTFQIDATATSLIFDTDKFPPATGFLQNIYKCIVHNKENMKNIVLMTLGYGVFPQESTDSDTLVAINAFLEEQCPSLKVSIQNEHFCYIVKKAQLIDQKRMIDHNRNNPIIYQLSNYGAQIDGAQVDLSSLRSPFFFYSWIRLCKKNGIEYTKHNQEINKVDLYLSYKKSDGCKKMLEKLEVVKKRLEDIGCECPACDRLMPYVAGNAILFWMGNPPMAFDEDYL